MNHFNDDQLESSADRARARELSSLHEMLLHLKEIDRRKLFSKRGFPSIYEYGMARFKYSYDEVHRRYCATKLIKDMPELEAKIKDGSLQLTHLTQAQSFFKKVAHTKEQKLEILSKLENTTKSETRKILYNEEVNARYYFEAHKVFEEKVERAKGLHPHLSFDKLMEKIFDIALEKLDPTVQAERIEAKVLARKEVKLIAKGEAQSVVASGLKTNELQAPINSRAGAKTPSRYIAANVKRKVWLQAEGKCQNCRSMFALEFDHIVPFAKGGSNAPENLRLLCRSCNQRHGIEAFGLKQMETRGRTEVMN